MSVKEDYLTSYRKFFESFAATVNPEDQLPVQVAGYTITQAELPGEILLWTTQYLTEKNCPKTLLTPLRRIILDEVLTASKKQPSDFGFRNEESVYIALRLMQAVAAKVNDVCLRYLDNAHLDTLPPPPAIPDRPTTSAALKNTRRVMEDRHVQIGNLEELFGIETSEPTSFYAVYDGHAGTAAAVYCAAHLHQYLVESVHFKTDLRQALNEAFLRTDADFVRKRNQERANGGSTAVVVVIRGKTLHAAWAGDSQAVLAKKLRILQLVQPHKPSREDEKDRIEAMGGTVLYWGTWRVNGQLAVSRAIGDAPYKPYVTAKPDIATIDLDGDEDFVVVACDGLWDYMSEDQVALAVYYQLVADPNDLGAVTKRLVCQAKHHQSTDNISVIVVLLRDVDTIISQPGLMEARQNNLMANAALSPFPADSESCKRQLDVSSCDEPADNGLDNSDSDSEDLGPETAVDVDVDDVDAEKTRVVTPPANGDHAAEEEGQIDGALADNVAESGEESEDEWNYFKGDKEHQPGDQNPSEEPDELPHSETPCQDNSACESSSVDMNSSPLNPDAPVFIPGTVAGADVLLAESPRKPLPMDDIELPADVNQFETEAVVRPKDLLDLDNCDQLNGHHNISLDEAAKLNGNDKSLDSLGFGFNVGADLEKPSDMIQDFDRIQKDTTDFCNIQVLQSHTETNPFSTEADEALLERLKNKESDPMSMSFYQEKDDDTCERLAALDPPVDLNAVQTLPDNDDDEDCNTSDLTNQNDKENVFPQTDLIGTDEAPEPNNDIIRLDDNSDLLNNANFAADNATDYNINATQLQNMVNINFDNAYEEPLQQDTPESHKLLFEQIPEIPDGKSSELGFTDDLPSESENRAFSPQDETSHDVEMESKQDDSPLVAAVPDIHFDRESPVPVQQIEEDKDSGVTTDDAQGFDMDQELDVQVHEEPVTATPEPTQDFEDFGVEMKEETSFPEEPQRELETPEKFEADVVVEAPPVAESPFREEASPSPAPSPSPSPATAPAPAHTEDLIPHSPAPSDRLESPAPVQTDGFISESPIPEPVIEPRVASPLPVEVASSPPSASPIPPSASPLPPSASPLPPAASPLPPAASPLPAELPTSSEVFAAEALSRLTPEVQESGPAPDLVPEQVTDLDLDLDLGVIESRAQEICVPVTSEIRDEVKAPVEEAQVAANIAAPEPQAEVPAAAAAVAAVGAVAAAAAVAKSKSPVKKAATPISKTAPKTTPKSSPLTRTPLSAAKKPASAASTPAKPTPARTTPAKTATPKSATPARPATAPARPAAAAAKPAPKPATTANKPPVKAPATVKEPISRTARPTSTSAPKPAPARPAAAPARPAAPRAAPAPRPAPARVPLSKPKEAEKKPLTNGEAARAPIRKPAAPSAAAPAAAPAAARPAPRPAAPRPTPRAATATAAAKPASATAPRPAPRSAPARPLDKPLKELANKRTTSTTTKTAPPRTAATKAPPKPNTMRPVPKKPIEKKPEEMNGLTNGDSAPSAPAAAPPSPDKLPPSPSPATDATLLPDVIA